jgi:hypothetical protein
MRKLRPGGLPVNMYSSVRGHAHALRKLRWTANSLLVALPALGAETREWSSLEGP